MQSTVRPSASALPFQLVLMEDFGSFNGALGPCDCTFRSLLLFVVRAWLWGFTTGLVIVFREDSGMVASLSAADVWTVCRTVRLTACQTARRTAQG